MSEVSTNEAYPSSERRLEGKVAIITGGASGIGEATAKLFSRHGAKVIIADIQDERGQSVCAAIGSDDIISFVHCDVTKESDIKNIVDFAVGKYGKLDIMFNNAGIADRPCSRIMDSDLEEFERIMSVNCTGVFTSMKHAAGVMVASRTKGSIINMASVASIVAAMTPHAYTASKHAVVGLTKSGAAELGQYGIRVNCISPFFIATPLVKGFMGTEEDQIIEEAVSGMTNLKGGAVLKPEDIALAAVYFGSDESKYVSGHNFVVDGGVTVVNNYLGLFKQNP